MQARLSLLLALSSSLLLSACGGGSNSSRAVAAPPATNSGGTPVTAVITARFDPSNAVVPFPTNLLLSGTTDLTLNIPVANPTNIGDPAVATECARWLQHRCAVEYHVQHAAASRRAMVRAAPTARVRVFEVTLTGPGGGVTSVVRELQSPQEFVVALAPSDTTGRTLAILPTTPLKQLTSYMAVLLGNGGELNPASIAEHHRCRRQRHHAGYDLLPRQAHQSAVHQRSIHRSAAADAARPARWNRCVS